MPPRGRVLRLAKSAVPVCLGALVIAALVAWSISIPGPSNSGHSKVVLASAPVAATGPAAGYGLVASDGGVFTYGGAAFHGSAGSAHLNAPIVDMAATPDGGGYWLVASDGGVFSYGDAVFHGSGGGLRLNAPIVDMAATPDGGGYWLVASDGGVFTYGDAVFHGSGGGLRLNAPIVDMAATPDGGGYWLVASDGGVFSYGDAVFHGSAGSLHLNEPVAGMAATPDGGGYRLVASDGGVFTYGDAVFDGSAGGQHLNAPIVDMAAAPDGGGYWLVASDGGVFSYGDAVFRGSIGATHLNAPIVAMARLASTQAPSLPAGTSPPASTAQAPAPAGVACVTSSPTGSCPFPDPQPEFTGTVPNSTPEVDVNMWNPIAGASVMLSASSPSLFTAVANMPAGNTAVVSYTNSWAKDYVGTVDSYSQITQTTSETMPHNAQTSAWAMDDNWFNNWADEVMIQYDFTGNADCDASTVVATNVSFGGTNGVPVQQWHLCDFTSPGDSGHTLDWKLGATEGTGRQSEPGGKIDILAMTKWLESHTDSSGSTYLPASSTWTGLSSGWEICTTGGQPETFTMNNFTVDAS